MCRPRSPAAPIWVRLAMTVLVGSNLSPPLCGASASESVREEIRARLPKYDAKIREDHLAQQDAVRKAADSATLYGVKQGSTEPLSTVDATGETITLPRMVVHALDQNKPQDPAVQLPRLVVRPAGKDQAPDGFETPAAKDERLMKKHLSAFDRLFLNRLKLPPLFGTSNEKRARDAEAVEQSARRLNEISELVTLSDTGEPETKEDRELKKAYLDAFVSRPK